MGYNTSICHALTNIISGHSLTQCLDFSSAKEIFIDSNKKRPDKAITGLNVAYWRVSSSRSKGEIGDTSIHKYAFGSFIQNRGEGGEGKVGGGGVLGAWDEKLEVHFNEEHPWIQMGGLEKKTLFKA